MVSLTNLFICIFVIGFCSLIDQSIGQSVFSCATHQCNNYMDRSCLKVRNAMPGIYLNKKVLKINNNVHSSKVINY